MRVGQHNLAVANRGQVMVGHQHLQPQGARAGDAVKTGDAVVNRDQHVGAAVLDALRDRRGQAVAVDHTVGHDVVHVLGAQQAQAAYAHGAGGGAVAVVIGHDAEFFVGRDRVGQQPGGLDQSPHLARRNQARQTIVEFLHALHTAGRIKLGQQRMDAGLLQRPGAARRNIARHYFHRCSSRLKALGVSNIVMNRFQ